MKFSFSDGIFNGFGGGIFGLELLGTEGNPNASVLGGGLDNPWSETKIVF